MVTGQARAGVFAFADLPLGQALIWARAAVAGRVLDAKGQPLTNASINVQYENKGQQMFESFLGGTSLTDADGHFRVNGIVPGEAVPSRNARSTGLAGRENSGG